MTDDIHGINSNPLRIKRLNLKQQNHKKNSRLETSSMNSRRRCRQEPSTGGHATQPRIFEITLPVYENKRLRSYFPFLLLKKIRLQKRKSRLEMLFHPSANHQTSCPLSSIGCTPISCKTEDIYYLERPQREQSTSDNLRDRLTYFNRNRKDIVKQP